MTDDTRADPAAAQSVGGMLEDARCRAQLTVTDIAERTRIRPGIIRDIERDDFSTCGGTFYARGHVRAVAATLGMDEEDVLAEFDRTQDRTAPRLTPTALPDFPPTEAAGRARAKTAGSRWVSVSLGVAALVVVVLVVVVIVGLVHGSGGGGPRAASQGTPGVSAPSSRAAARPSTAPSAAPTSVTLLLSVSTSRSWVRITGSVGTQLFQGVLQPGDVRSFQDPISLTVRYGNAAAVSTELNGTPLGRPSCTGGAVCTLVYTVHGSPSPSSP